MNSLQRARLESVFPIRSRWEYLVLDTLERLQQKKRIVVFGAEGSIVARCLLLADGVVYASHKEKEEEVLDFSEILLAAVPSHASRFQYVCGTMESDETLWRVALQEGDVVLCSDSLHGYENPGALLRRIYDQLPSGSIVVKSSTVELKTEEDVALLEESLPGVGEYVRSQLLGFLQLGGDPHVERMRELGLEDETSVVNFLSGTGLPIPSQFVYRPACPCECSTCDESVRNWFAMWEKPAGVIV